MGLNEVFQSYIGYFCVLHDDNESDEFDLIIPKEKAKDVYGVKDLWGDNLPCQICKIKDINSTHILLDFYFPDDNKPVVNDKVMKLKDINIIKY